MCIISRPQNPILIIKAPILRSVMLACRKTLLTMADYGAVADAAPLPKFSAPLAFSLVLSNLVS